MALYKRIFAFTGMISDKNNEPTSSKKNFRNILHGLNRLKMKKKSSTFVENFWRTCVN